MVYKLGWFSTGRDEAACDLLQTVYNAIESGDLNAKIDFVFSNREKGESEQSDKFFAIVREYGIDLICFSSKNFKPRLRKEGEKNPKFLEKWKMEYDREIMKLLDKFNPDLYILAGYMLIVSDEMCKKYNMINLHPAAPEGPKGTWQEVIWKLIESETKETGIRIHLVTEVLDEGPAITYCTSPIKGGIFDELWQGLKNKLKTKNLKEIIEDEGENNELFKEIRKQGVIRELPLLLYTIKKFVDGTIDIENKKIFVDGERCSKGLPLTDVIDEIVKSAGHIC